MVVHKKNKKTQAPNRCKGFKAIGKHSLASHSTKVSWKRELVLQTEAGGKAQRPFSCEHKAFRSTTDNLLFTGCSAEAPMPRCCRFAHRNVAHVWLLWSPTALFAYPKQPRSIPLSYRRERRTQLKRHPPPRLTALLNINNPCGRITAGSVSRSRAAERKLQEKKREEQRRADEGDTGLDVRSPHQHWRHHGTRDVHANSVELRTRAEALSETKIAGFRCCSVAFETLCLWIMLQDWLLPSASGSWKVRLLSPWWQIIHAAAWQRRGGVRGRMKPAEREKGSHATTGHCKTVEEQMESPMMRTLPWQCRLSSPFPSSFFFPISNWCINMKRGEKINK